MAAFIIIFIALAFALMMFSGLQEKLPDELGFLRMEGASQQAPAPAREPSSSVVDGTGNWQRLAVNGTVELVRRLPGEMVVGGVTYDTPYLGILCHDGVLDMRVDTRLPTTGYTHTPVQVNGVHGMWAKGTEMNIFPPSPAEFLKAQIKARKPVSFMFSFRDLGLQTLQLPAGELAAAAAALPVSCQRQVQ